MFWLVVVSTFCTVNIKMTNLNPTPPTIRGLIKSHIASAPIGPIVNWANAPQCTLATITANSLESYLPLPHVFNVKSMTHLILIISLKSHIIHTQNLFPLTLQTCMRMFLLKNLFILLSGCAIKMASLKN